jgi:diaminopimelate epimerase
MQNNFFIKSHGLGNDYLVFDSSNISFKIHEKSIRLICNVHYGIGSDGILLVVPSNNADFGLRIYNPDGSEAEKSGNGLRIFAKFLFDYNYTEKSVFSIETPGGLAKAEIAELKNGKATLIAVDMGKPVFVSTNIPVSCDQTECFDFPLIIEGRKFLINCVSVGNPHCTIFTEKLDIEEVHKFGSKIENHPMFPNRINVQFAKVVSNKEIEILIWERGAGYTLASGSSSSAVASIARKKGLVGNSVNIKMPGGNLRISFNDDGEINLCGGVKQIAEGTLNEELLEDLMK